MISITNVTVGIDATRCRSGGAVAHVRGLLGAVDPAHYCISNVHLWAFDELLDAVENRAWLVKHQVTATRGSIIRQIAWQYFRLPRIAEHLGVDVMFNTDAGSVCPFQPSVTLSQDMLSFEPGEMNRFSWSNWARLRLELLRYIQLYRLKNSTRALFLSEYAKRIVGQLLPLPESTVVPHGIDPLFFEASTSRSPWADEGPIRCLYVSNAAPYKHQWHVVDAIAQLRAKTGRDLKLRLVGGGVGGAMSRLRAAVTKHDPHGGFVQLVEFKANAAIPGELANADIFIYASSCENLPITLLEAMAAGLPIASSDRGPMPEALGNAAVFFDPENPNTISDAVFAILSDAPLRHRISADAQRRARLFTWERCADLTWQAIFDSVKKINQDQ